MRRFVQVLALICGIFFAETGYAHADFVVLVGDAVGSESLPEDFRKGSTLALVPSFEGSHPGMIWNPTSVGFGIGFNSNSGNETTLSRESAAIESLCATGAFALGFAGDGLDGFATDDFVNPQVTPSEGHGATFFVVRVCGFRPAAATEFWKTWETGATDSAGSCALRFDTPGRQPRAFPASLRALSVPYVG